METELELTTLKKNAQDSDYNSNHDFLQYVYNSDSDSISSVIAEEEKKYNSKYSQHIEDTTQKIITQKNDTFDKLCKFLIKINELEKKLNKITNDRDKLEEKLRLTQLELNNKKISLEEIEKKNKILQESIDKYIERVITVRNKALYRKTQVYLLVIISFFSILENIYNGIINIILNFIITSTKFIIFNDMYEIIIIKNTLIFGYFIYLIYKKYMNK